MALNNLIPTILILPSIVSSFSVKVEFRPQRYSPPRRPPKAWSLSSSDQLPSSSASAARAPVQAKAPTVDPIIERARQRAGVPVAEPPATKLYDDDLLLDMQRVLVALERRVKGGPSSLALEDVEEMSAAVGRILDEMKSTKTSSTSWANNTPPLQLSNPSVHSNPSGDLLHAEPEIILALHATATASSSVAAAPVSAGERQLDTSDDEGPPYTGQGGMGQPRGTVNTYVIPGMDEMTAEEYQQTLQQSIIDRQKRRRASGVVGNLSSSSYLDGL
jgi:hypothetical protein